MDCCRRPPAVPFRPSGMIGDSMIPNEDASPNTTAELPPKQAGSPLTPAAPWIHTAGFIAILLVYSYLGALAQRRPVHHANHIYLYLGTIVWEWLLVGYIVLGIRRRGVRLRDLVAGRWKSATDVLRDIAVAIGFWFVSMLILGLIARALGLGGAGAETEVKNKLGALIPATKAELALFIVVSLTAGFCEEVMFRGYLQRQFAALTRVGPAAIVLQGIFFGLGHGYEGSARMIVIAVYGVMFGMLAVWRKSLRPGMISHAMHDSLSGIFLYVHFMR
jgi:CAAX protease family protein